MFCNLCIWTPVIIFRNLNLLCYKQTTPWWHKLNITITKLVIWLTSSWTQLCLCAYLLSYHQPDENVCKIIITIFCCDGYDCFCLFGYCYCYPLIFCICICKYFCCTFDIYLIYGFYDLCFLCLCDLIFYFLLFIVKHLECNCASERSPNNCAVEKTIHTTCSLYEFTFKL